MTKITYIPGEIANAAIDEHGNRKPVTRTQHIFDDNLEKSQSQVNQETNERVSTLENKVGPGGSVDERIAVETQRAQDAEGFLQNQINGINSQNYVTIAATNTWTLANINSLISTAAGADAEKADTMYRVGNWDGSQFDASVYSEYAWDGSEYIHLSTKTQIGEIFDISAYHATGGVLAKYANLAVALGTNGANVPTNVRQGGMSIKFVQSSDNKYVQYRLMSDTFNTTVANWQGVDDEPTAGSDNLVKSGGAYNAIGSSKSESPVNEDGFHVIDENLNVGMKYGEDGLDVAKVSSHFIEVLKASGISADDVMSSHASLVNEDGFFITDEELNIGVKVDSDGIHSKNILEYEIVED